MKYFVLRIQSSAGRNNAKQFDPIKRFCKVIFGGFEWNILFFIFLMKQMLDTSVTQRRAKDPQLLNSIIMGLFGFAERYVLAATQVTHSVSKGTDQGYN